MSLAHLLVVASIGLPLSPLQDNGRLGNDSDQPTQADFRSFRALISGRMPADSDNAREVLDKMCRWRVYRLTWREVQERVYLKELRTVMIPYIRQVLAAKVPIAGVNAMRVLHKFAQLGEEEVADEFIRALSSPGQK